MRDCVLFTTLHDVPVRASNALTGNYSPDQRIGPAQQNASISQPDTLSGFQAAQARSDQMTKVKTIAVAALMAMIGIAGARAECDIADARLEEAILQNPKLRGPANSQSVRDLRSLRDAAITLRSYGRHDDCERLLSNIRELIAGPSMGSLGDNDEDGADRQNAAREPKIRRGVAVGSRDKKDAKPLIPINQLVLGLRTDEMIGAEVRSSDDKIVGEVRNIVFSTKDGRDYAIVASGGFFTTGKDSIVVPIRSLKVTQDRSSFFLPISTASVRTVPLMPDQHYGWLSDQKWRSRNDALFQAR